MIVIKNLSIDWFLITYEAFSENSLLFHPKMLSSLDGQPNYPLW